MKNLIILIASAILFISCKKETAGSGGGGGPKQILLTEIKNDGLIANRMEYNSDNLITKIEGYTAELTNNTVNTYVVFSYNEDKQVSQYMSYGMPGNIPAQKVTIAYDDAGKLVSAASYDLQGPTPNTAINTTHFSYNAKGLVNKSVLKNKGGETMSQTNFIYYEDGHLKERQLWMPNDGMLWLKSRYAYSMPNGYYQTGLEQIRVLVGSEFIANMHSDAINFKTYDQAGVIKTEYSHIMSNRQYNTDGSLKQQVKTTQHIKPVQDDESVIEEFKYTAQ